MTKVPITIGLPATLNTSVTGALTFLPWSTAFWKTGVSSSFKRTYKPISTMTAEAKNGMRQPHSMKGPLVSPRVYPSAENRIENRPLARQQPNGAPNCGHMDADARWSSVGGSDASGAAADHPTHRRE